MKDIKVVKLAGGRFSLSRDSDGSGDSGPMLRSIGVDGKQVGENGELHFDCAIQCGSFFARTMQWQDWWLTTSITEFLEVSEDNKKVKFKTKNSIYTVTAF